MIVNGVPATAEAGTEESTNAVALDGITVVPGLEVTLRAPSVAVMDWVPLVLRVSWKDPTPSVRPELAGKVAALSLDWIEMLPVYPVTVLPAASLAVTDTLIGLPDVMLEGTLPRTRLDTVPGLTTTLAVLCIGLAPESRLAPIVTAPARTPVKLVL
jgi:hypothetical protein